VSQPSEREHDVQGQAPNAAQQSERTDTAPGPAGQADRRRSGRRRPGRPPLFWEILAALIIRPLSRLLLRHDWATGQLPREGGVILVANHLSWTDPVLLGHFVYNNGRWPVILAKASLFKVPVLGRIIDRLQAIPVHRGTTDATLSLKIAEERLNEGACVIIYPEGTITRDPDLWPMVGKTGAARLALATGAPVIPVAHWGAQELLPYGEKKPRLFPRKTFQVRVGPPVDLSAYAGRPMTASLLREATADIMAAITGLLAEIRQEKPPAEPYDPKNAGGDRRAVR